MGRDDDALAAYERAIAIVPQPDYLAALGDIAARAGDGGRATKAYATIDAIASLAPERARLYDRQLALFDVDHGRSPERALEIASASLAARPDIYGLDAYAWALYANGRYADARTASDRARALGTADARLLYHAGTISLALGDAARGRDELTAALRLSPEFDPLQAARARDALGARP
jgi:tetratricopeptide (TPR) repeat protein